MRLVHEIESAPRSTDLSPTDLSRQTRVPANRISQIVDGKCGITGHTALRLARWFGTSPQFWMNLQALHDVRSAEQQAGPQIRSLSTEPGHRKTAHPRPL